MASGRDTTTGCDPRKGDKEQDELPGATRSQRQTKDASRPMPGRIARPQRDRDRKGRVLSSEEREKRKAARLRKQHLVGLTKRQAVRKEVPLSRVALENAPWDTDKPSMFAKLEGAHGTVDKNDVINQVHRSVSMSHVTVLTGGNGCGKSTAALLFSRWICDVQDCLVYFVDVHHCIQAYEKSKNVQSLIVVDDFMGKSLPDDQGTWKVLVHFLGNFLMSSAEDQTHFLLVTRKSVLEASQSSYGADFALITGKANVIHISSNHEKMFKSMLGEVKMKKPDFQLSPSIGFPLCCRLAPHLPPAARDVLFQQPRLALRLALAELMQGNDLARTALALLAVTETYVDTRVLLNSKQFADSPYFQVLEALMRGHPKMEAVRSIVSFYMENGYIILAEDDFVSFANEVIREVVLVALCDSQPEVLAQVCSLRHLSQIASATHDEGERIETRETTVLKDSAMSAFLKRLLQEVDTGNYKETFTSALLQHESFRQRFEEKVDEGSLVERWIDTYDKEGLHFLFWAGACASVHRRALARMDRKDHWMVCQALVSCCYWGHVDAIGDLLGTFKNKAALKKALKEARLEELVTGSLPGLTPRAAVAWAKAPFHPEDTLMTLAAWRGHDAVVRLLAYRGMPVDSRGKNQCTALMHYCARGNADMAELLLKKNAGTSVVDVYRMTPLLYAVYRGEWSMPEELVNTRSMKSQNIMLQTPLILACASGWGVGLIRKFIDEGADPLLCDATGINCLHHVCWNGQIESVEYLLKNVNFNPDVQAKSGSSALGCAVLYPRRTKLIESLLTTGAKRQHSSDTTVQRRPTDSATSALPKWICPDDVRNAFIVACAYSDRDVLKKLSDLCSPDEDTQVYALHKAAQHGNVEALRFLTRCSTDPRWSVAPDDTSCLFAACQGGSPECVLLLGQGVNTDQASEEGVTLLMRVLCSGHLEVAEKLMYRGARLTRKDVEGKNCLYYAVQSNSVLLVDWCVRKQNMTIDAVNKFDETPLFWAISCERPRTAKYLLDAGADPTRTDVDGNTCFHEAARKGNVELIELLLDPNSPIDKNFPNHRGDTPLMLACEGGHEKAARFLGLDVDSLNRENQGGQNCLEFAVLSGNISMVEACLPYFEHDIHTRCSEKNTLLLVACQNGDRNMVQWLLSQNADLRDVNEDGMSCLDLAVSSGEEDLINFLSDPGRPR